MTDTINETINVKEAVLFACNSMNELTRRFGEMLKYCAKNKLRIVNVFFEPSAMDSHEKKCMLELIDYLKRNKTKTAVVFYRQNEFCSISLSNKLNPFLRSGQIELHFAKDNVIVRE